MKYQHQGFTPLVIILLVVLGIGVVGGGYVVYKDKQQQKKLEIQIQDLQDQAVTTKQETAQILRYISRDQVGVFKIDAPIPSQDSFSIEGYLLTEKTIYPEGHPQKIYVVSKNDKQLLTFNVWGLGKIGDIKVQSSEFRTDKSIAVGSTISDFIKAYPQYRLWYTAEEGEKFILNTAINAPTPQFFLKREDLLDSKKNFHNKEIKVSDFNANAKIAEIRVYYSP